MTSKEFLTWLINVQILVSEKHAFALTQAIKVVIKDDINLICYNPIPDIISRKINLGYINFKIISYKYPNITTKHGKLTKQSIEQYPNDLDLLNSTDPIIYDQPRGGRHILLFDGVRCHYNENNSQNRFDNIHSIEDGYIKLKKDLSRYYSDDCDIILNQLLIELI